MSYITVEEVQGLWRTMTTEEMERTEQMLPGTEDALRLEASKRGKNLDTMIETGEISKPLLKLTIAGIIARSLSADTSGSNGLLSQESQSGLGYTWTGTYVSTGGGIVNILNNDLKKLGILRQRYGAIDFYGTDERKG